MTRLLSEAGRRARESGGVLSPRLLLALDEAANFSRIPRLPAYASTGPGQGIHLLLAFHDLAQVEASYGRPAARTIWNNCRARLLLPGQGDLETLEQFSRAMGNETRLYGAGPKGQAQRLSRPLASVDELRRLQGAVLVYGSAPPARLRLRRWDEVDAWRRMVAPAPAEHRVGPATRRRR